MNTWHFTIYKAKIENQFVTTLNNETIIGNEWNLYLMKSHIIGNEWGLYLDEIPIDNKGFYIATMDALLKIFF